MQFLHYRLDISEYVTFILCQNAKPVDDIFVDKLHSSQVNPLVYISLTDNVYIVKVAQISRMHRTTLSDNQSYAASYRLLVH